MDKNKKKEVYRIYEFFEGMKEQLWFMEGLGREVNLLRLGQRASELRDMNTNNNEIVFIDVKDDTVLYIRLFSKLMKKKIIECCISFLHTIYSSIAITNDTRVL